MTVEEADTVRTGTKLTHYRMGAMTARGTVHHGGEPWGSMIWCDTDPPHPDWPYNCHISSIELVP